MEEDFLHTLLAHASRVLSDAELDLLAEHDVLLTGPTGLRRFLGERDFAAFLALYFGDELSVAWSATHREIISTVQDIRDRYVTDRRGRKCVFALPRGMGKSSLLARFQPLWRFLSGSSPLTLLVGNNAEASSRLVRNSHYRK